MKSFVRLARWALWSGAAWALGGLPAMAAPVFLNPLLTMAFVEAAAVNTYVQPGVSRNTYGSGPISDAASELYGLSTADSSASVTATGLHAAASVHNASTGGASAAARSLAGIVNPFFIVPKAGFVGTSATIRIDYHLGGALNDTPNCSTCFEFVQADLGVDGMADQFHFYGVHSMGTASNPNGNVSGVNMGGTLVGLVPVNTELYFRGSLYMGVHCQAAPTCDASALFGGTLGYFGYSSDAVDIVWGLAPAAPQAPEPPQPTPEPASALLGLTGLALLGWQRRGLREA